MTCRAKSRRDRTEASISIGLPSPEGVHTSETAGKEMRPRNLAPKATGSSNFAPTRSRAYLTKKSIRSSEPRGWRGMAESPSSKCTVSRRNPPAHSSCTAGCLRSSCIAFSSIPRFSQAITYFPVRLSKPANEWKGLPHPEGAAEATGSESCDDRVSTQQHDSRNWRSRGIITVGIDLAKNVFAGTAFMRTAR